LGNRPGAVSNENGASAMTGSASVMLPAASQHTIENLMLRPLIP
jgi:hypothetical protein